MEASTSQDGEGVGLTTQSTSHLEREQYTAIAIYLTLVGISATAGNILVICILFIQKGIRKTPHHYIILNMAISDLGISVFGYPFTTAACYAGRWLIGHTGCIITGFMCTTLALTNINSLLVLSVYRYIAVCKPNLKPNLSKRRVVSLSIGSCWLYSLAWSISPLIGWSSYDFENFGTSCSIKWNGREAGEVTYTVLMTLGCYISHIGVIGWCYYHVLMTSTRALANLKNPMNTDRAIEVQKTIREIKTTWMILIMVSAFIIVWSPYAWVAFWSMLNPETVPLWLFTFPTIFAKSSCMLNPIIYLVTDRTFRQAARFVLLGKCRNSVEPLSEHIYNVKVPSTLDVQRAGMVNTTEAGVYIGNNVIPMTARPRLF